MKGRIIWWRLRGSKGRPRNSWMGLRGTARALVQMCRVQGRGPGTIYPCQVQRGQGHRATAGAFSFLHKTEFPLRDNLLWDLSNGFIVLQCDALHNAPLTNPLSPKVKLDWSPQSLVLWIRKSLISCAPASRLVEPCRLQEDARNLVTGGALLQTGMDGIDHPVSFFSRKFNTYQSNYSFLETDALALIWALKHFAVYVGGGGKPLVVYTDHSPCSSPPLLNLLRLRTKVAEWEYIKWVVWRASRWFW